MNKNDSHLRGNVQLFRSLSHKTMSTSNQSYCISSKLIAGILLLLLTPKGSAQWENPGERYANAYQKYTDTECPIEEDAIKHFVYFARDRNAIQDHPLLAHGRFSGAQIMYPWSLLEPSKNEYDFSIIQQDYEYLKEHGKKLFVQLQDTTFNPDFRGVPAYLISDEYHGGTTPQFAGNGVQEGWTAKRWNKAVQTRFALLLKALGENFDGKIEGINLQETAVGLSQEKDPSFTPAAYAKSIQANMRSLKNAFPTSTTMQYANFMPGEWLPWEDEGYLKSIYEYGNKIGVGLGAPDLMVKRKGQLNHALAMMHEGEFDVPLGVAVQDGNYVGLTGADFPPGSGNADGSLAVKKNRKNIVPLLHVFAKDFLNVQYIFWVNQKPYFEEDVLSCFTNASR